MLCHGCDKNCSAYLWFWLFILSCLCEMNSVVWNFMLILMPIRHLSCLILENTVGDGANGRREDKDPRGSDVKSRNATWNRWAVSLNALLHHGTYSQTQVVGIQVRLRNHWISKRLVCSFVTVAEPNAYYFKVNVFNLFSIERGNTHVCTVYLKKIFQIRPIWKLAWLWKDSFL